MNLRRNECKQKAVLMNISSFDDIHGNATLDKQYHWSSNPEDEGSIPRRKALELNFSQLVQVWVL